MEIETILKETIEQFKNVVKVRDDGYIYDITKEGKYTIDKFTGVVTYDFKEPQNDKRYVILKSSFHAAEIVECEEKSNTLKHQDNIKSNLCDFKKITDSLAELLEYKNKKYGDSALNPMNIFQGKTKVGQRVDDKLARVKNSSKLMKNDIADLIGYLTLICVENGWDNFDEFKD